MGGHIDVLAHLDLPESVRKVAFPVWFLIRVYASHTVRHAEGAFRRQDPPTPVPSPPLLKGGEGWGEWRFE